MSKLPSLTPREAERILLRLGFVPDTGKGSHRTYYHPTKKLHTTVSFHPGAIPTGTLRAIIKQTGLSPEEFLSRKKR